MVSSQRALLRRIQLRISEEFACAPERAEVEELVAVPARSRLSAFGNEHAAHGVEVVDLVDDLVSNGGE